jgi:hypothetical protein
MIGSVDSVTVMQGKAVLEEEDELIALIGQKAAHAKIERVAAYRQLQACSHMTQLLNGRSLDDYDVDGVHVRAVGPNEWRVNKQENGKTMSYIVDTVAATSKQVLPPDLVNVPLLVILLDQGSIGAAGTGFSDYAFKMVLMKFEKIHRLIRDIKLSLLHSCGGVLTKAQVYSSSLWNCHQKPFASGYFGTQLQRALNVFAMRHTVDSLLFQKYLPRIAKEQGVSFTTRAEQDG